MPQIRLFYRLILRPMMRERGRAALILFAVAVGVSVVLAIQLSGNAAAGSFRSSLETLAGDNDLEVTAAGGVPEDVVGKLDRLPYPMRVTPRIEAYATVKSSGQAIPLIGIDLIGAANDAPAERPLENTTATSGIEHINDPDAVWISHSMGSKVGDHLALVINDHDHDYMVRGFIPQSANVSGEAVVMDIGAAQEATQQQGRVDRILLKVPTTENITVWEQRIRTALPAGVELKPQGSQTDANRRMLAAFRWNLRVLSYVALLVGAFLIYNAISVSVVRRRADIGTLRALGASRNAVLCAFLAEAVIFGTAGALIALPLGRLLASAAVHLLAATVNALYVSSHPGSLSLTPGTVFVAFFVGIAAAVASALAPAREASLVPPTEAMARGRRDYTVRVERKRDALFSVGLALLGVLAARLPALDGKPLFGYVAALLFVAASALITPALVYWTTSAASHALQWSFGIEAMLASRSLGGSLRRTSVLVGSLSTAIAMMTSVGIMVGSFRQTVITWMDSELPADLYLQPAGASRADRHPLLDVGLPDQIAKLPGVETVSRFRAYEIQYQGLPATLASVDPDLSHGHRVLTFLSGKSSTQVLTQLISDPHAVIVSEPFVNKHHVKAGDSITLPLGEKSVTFHVLDVFYDYGSEAGYIMAARPTLLRYLPDPAVSNLAVYVAPGANIETVRDEIKQATSHREVLIFTNREIRREAVRVFDQTFAITYALEAVAVIVAVMGIAGALISIVFDRRREFGVLRFLGASTKQIRKLILFEAGLLGILANITGLVLGFALSLVLIFVINKQSFGWTIQFHWPVAILIGALSLVYIATVLAGIYPARIATRLNPVEVVHEE